MSGTTAITVLVRGRTIYVANCGDSRAVIAERRGKDFVAMDLSIDQTPFRADELERVKLSGARVLTLDQIEGLKNPDVQCWDTEEGDDGDPPRVWVQNGMYPGTAFTRSIGDSIAESIGVVASPEIVVLELTENHPFFVLASDGVFEFLSSQTVVDMVAKFTDPRDACAAIGGEGDCFYVVGSGEFEVFAAQEEENGKEVIRVLHTYTAEKLSSFGELALMYNKPLQASVRAVTSGTLWALKREDFRGILMSEFSNLSSLKLLRSVEIFSRLTILQLNNISSVLEEISYSDGQTIMGKNECISALHIILKGQVRVTYDGEVLQKPSIRSLPSVIIEQQHQSQNNSENEVLFSEGSHFGEWTLLGEKISSLSAVAVGEVVCAVITKDKFDSAIGPLPKLPPDDRKYVAPLCMHLLRITCILIVLFYKEMQLSDNASIQEWRMGICATDCSELGLVLLKGSDNVLSLKRFSKKRIKQLGKEAQVLKERDLMKSLSQSAHVPCVLRTCADQSYLGILINACLSCSLSSILYKPLDEASARFCAASVVVALEELHNNAILYRGVSPEILMFDQHGHLQLVDFRFGKKLKSERTFTICGIADSLSPEILKGKGHGFATDWWALGVLIYFMLEAEMPFGSWRQSELETFAKIAKGHLTLPETFSEEVIDLITKLLEVDETERLGSQGVDSIKKHPWFHGLDWKAFANCNVPVPQEITSRIDYYLENHVENTTASVSSFSEDTVDPKCPDWFEDW
ncbi:hypothetical protein Taro_053617 [Colocasia esculenta]|uniref:protein-serine/threonine phosphatase n=1 Tax=Colocasia esculenta TaxID=4460 RepID=A0A843XN44_COLES|nr:hypothetical protein [Colocasia esculenta]